MKSSPLLIAALLSVGLMACNDDGASATDNAGTAGGGQTGGEIGGAGGIGSTNSSASTGGFGGSGGSSTVSTGGGNTGGTDQLIYETSFDGDAAAWPSPWEVSGGVDTADIVGGRARLTPVLSGYSLARMSLPANELNVEATYSFMFSDVSRQGIGFYVRSNGGYLAQTNPAGQGFGIFVEGFSGQPGIGFWHELDGDEIEMHDVPFTLVNNVDYRVRVRVSQFDATHTQLQARLWAEGDPEPSTWTIEHMADQPHLQDVAGGFLLDAWSTNNGPPAPQLYINDLTIMRLP